MGRERTIFKAILWKNWVLKKKHGFATFCEVFLPLFLIVVLGVVKILAPPLYIPKGWTDSTPNLYNSSSGTSYSLFDTEEVSGEKLGFGNDVKLKIPHFYFAETTLPGLLLAMSFRGYSEAIIRHDSLDKEANLCKWRFLYQGYVNNDPASAFAVPPQCNGKVIPYKLAIAPDNSFTRRYFFETISSWYPRIPLTSDNFEGVPSFVIPALNDSIVWFKSAEAIDRHISGDGYGKTLNETKIYAGIVFEKFPEEVGKFGNFEYTLRFNTTQQNNVFSRDVPPSYPALDIIRNPLGNIKPKDYGAYATQGFMTLQTLIHRFINCQPTWSGTSPGLCQLKSSEIVNSTTDNLDATLLNQIKNDIYFQGALGHFNFTSNRRINIDDLSFEVKQKLISPLNRAPQPYFGAAIFPSPSEETEISQYYTACKFFFPIFFALSFLHSVLRIVHAYTVEKESKTKEYMVIIGVGEEAIVFSLYVIYITAFFFISMALTAASRIGLFGYSSIILLFSLYFLFSLNLLAFSFLISSFFSNVKSATFFTMLVYVASYTITFTFDDSTSKWVKYVAATSPSVAFKLCSDVLMSYEMVSTGLNFDNLLNSVGNFQFLVGIGMLGGNFFVFTILGLYFEQIIPNKYGTQRRWYFPLCNDNPNDNFYHSNKLRKDYEGAPSGYQTTISISRDSNVEVCSQDEENSSGDYIGVIRNLRKVFSAYNGRKVAVKGMDLLLNRGQLTCLLGRNGAGKSTVVAMLTGLIKPTSGDAFLNGQDIRFQMKDIRRSTGVCLQQDILYPELTIREHLYLYAMIRGFQGEELERRVRKRLEEIGLKEKQSAPASTLNGSTKRKLSVAIALLGDSKIVFLDEPTSGMDLYSRRSTWDFLQRNKKDRAIILTTQLIDEADILGDKVAIMAQGEVCCCGSPGFIKERYGTGYKLTLMTDSQHDEGHIASFISDRINAGKVLHSSTNEMSFLLPFEASKTFPSLFKKLDKCKAALNIISYNISVTTLEEVFLALTESDEYSHELRNTRKKRRLYRNEAMSLDSMSENNLSNMNHSSRPQYLLQIQPLFRKRLISAKRDKRTICFSIIIPIVAMVLGFISLKRHTGIEYEPKLHLDASSLYGEDSLSVPYYCENDEQSYCTNVFGSTTGAAPKRINTEQINSLNSPKLFGVSYPRETIESNGTYGTSLRLAHLFTSGSKTLTSYMVHASLSNNIFGYNMLVNSSVSHAAPIFKTVLDNAIYRYLIAKDVGGTLAKNAFTIKVNSHPLQHTAVTTAISHAKMSFITVAFVVAGFSLFPIVIMKFLVKEKDKKHNAKYQQIISGVNLGAFWIANYGWDMLTYSAPCAMGIALIQALDIGVFTASTCGEICPSNLFLAVVLLFVLFGLALIPFTYVVSHIFTNNMPIQSVLLAINTLVGLGFLILSRHLDSMDTTMEINQSLKFVYRCSPFFSFGNGLYNLAHLDVATRFLVRGTEVNVFHLDICGWEIFYLLGTAIIFYLISLSIDYYLVTSERSNLDRNCTAESSHTDEDADVANERHRLISGAAADELLQMYSLRKVYGKKDPVVAVDSLTLGIKKGECFALLGRNGAGKSSVLNMLAGGIFPTGGTATVDGFDILMERQQLRGSIGYCAQYDAHFDYLTVREHLELYAALRGIDSNIIDDVVTDVMANTALTASSKSLGVELGMGCKKKLSVAIALIGRPPVILLDEPSASIDVGSRRQLWQIISDITKKAKESAVIMATQNIEECESLCTKVGIMAEGKLKCIGSTSHLKNRFSNGLIMEVTLEHPSAECIAAMSKVAFGQIQELSARQVAESCSFLGFPGRKQLLTPGHPTGWYIHDILRRDGLLPVFDFCEWWISEDRRQLLLDFVQNLFEGATELERYNNFYRFKLKQSLDVSLCDIFENIEKSRSSLFIQEYSLSQASLDQVLDHFSLSPPQKTTATSKKTFDPNTSSSMGYAEDSIPILTDAEEEENPPSLGMPILEDYNDEDHFSESSNPYNNSEAPILGNTDDTSDITPIQLVEDNYINDYSRLRSPKN